ncbi:MAG: Pantothenate synthetase [Firmicutes bacterium]|nr:Pantothenate synthetase [Bacillota bacterium]
MQVIRTVAAMQDLRKTLPEESIGFVPTMGYLHAGHASLVARARLENACTVVSIFVNPTQFGPNEDFANYPRDEERDLELLATNNVDFVFMPSALDIYGAEKNTAVVHLHTVADTLEGAKRPGHFDGVCTVVAKLFNIVRPKQAYFGQKDAQQLAVIKKMVRDLNFAVKIIPCPTRRDPDGLAMSSRNVYLSPSDRATALLISRGLGAAKALWQEGQRDSALLVDRVRQEMAHGNFAGIDYVELVNGEDFTKMTEALPGAIIVVAAKVGQTRLIDNMVLE